MGWIDSYSKYYTNINGSIFTFDGLTSNDSYYFACYDYLNGTLVQATFIINYFIGKYFFGKLLLINDI